MLKKLSLLVAGVAFAAMMVLNFQQLQIGETSSGINLGLIINQALADSECEEAGGWPDEDEYEYSEPGVTTTTCIPDPLDCCVINW